MTFGMSGMLVLVLLAQGCVRIEPAAPARLKNITSEQAIAMVSQAKWEQSLCLEGTRTPGGIIRLEKIHPKDRERYAQGAFWVREPASDGKYVRLQVTLQGQRATHAIKVEREEEYRRLGIRFETYDLEP
jgi:hypothetical protein